VISSAAEINYIHHDYQLKGIRIAVHRGVKVIKEDRELTQDGAPDLAAPVAQ
jgi:hypothetical protein